MFYAKQSEFPYLKRFKDKFKITGETIFVYKGTIYANSLPPDDILEHEFFHLLRQNKLGVEKWIDNFLKNKEFRKKEEILAYLAQLRSIKNRELRNIVRIESAKNLSSSLYQLGIDFKTAFKLLKI